MSRQPSETMNSTQCTGEHVEGQQTLATVPLEKNSSSGKTCRAKNLEADKFNVCCFKYHVTVL